VASADQWDCPTWLFLAHGAIARAFAGRDTGEFLALVRGQLARRPALTVIVIIPTSFAILYYGLIASDVYVTESTFVIHSQSQQASPSGIGAVLQKTGLAGMGPSADNVSAVSEYITSRDALKELDGKMNLMKLWSSWWIDPLQRFAPLGLGKKFEYFYPYYKKHVHVDADEKSSLCTLSVRGFTARQSWRSTASCLMPPKSWLTNSTNGPATTPLDTHSRRSRKPSTMSRMPPQR